MSRLAQHPITIPEKTQITVDNQVVTVTGPKGELSRSFPYEQILLDVTDEGVTLTPSVYDKFTKSLWGTYASHIRNMITGVTEGYERKLVVEGVGYRVEVKGNTLELGVGYSHPVQMDIPEGLEVSVEKGEITITGIDKELIGSFAANVRSKRPPEPYKGKGIRFADEVIRRKQGKKAV